MSNTNCCINRYDVKDSGYKAWLFQEKQFHTWVKDRIILLCVAVVIIVCGMTFELKQSSNGICCGVQIEFFSTAKAEAELLEEHEDEQITIVEQVNSEYLKNRENAAIIKENKKIPGSGELVENNNNIEAVDLSLLKDITFLSYDDLDFTEKSYYWVYSAPYEGAFQFEKWIMMKANHDIQVAGCDNEGWVLVRYKVRNAKNSDFYRVGYIKGLKRKNNEAFPKLEWPHYYGEINNIDNVDWYFTDGRKNRNLAIKKGKHKCAAILGVIESEKYKETDEQYNGAYYVEILLYDSKETKVARGVVPQNAVTILYYNENSHDE